MIYERLRTGAVLIVYLVLAALLSPQAEAQQTNNLTLKIPIRKERRYYNYTTEDGSGRNCGVQLYAVWDVFKNYTNVSAYRYSLTGIQNPGSTRLVDDGQKKTFQVYCYFNGRSGPDRPDVNCDFTIGEGLPEWEATLTRTPPRANFTTTFYPSTPGEVKFQATSVDPEDPEANLLTHAWDFADNSNASGDIQIHRYTKPGRFNVKLTATNPDGLFGNATREVRIAAPRALVSMQLFSKHSLNRVEPEEEFQVRVTVEASSDGVGSLTNLVFNGPPLVVPSIFTVVSTPAVTNIGSLQPGQKKDFDWTLRTVGVGSFTLASASVAGRDEAGQVVSGSAATQRGQVTALIVGIEQRPPRILLGTDNNNDGKTNELDMRLELIVGITNVSKQTITDVKAVIVDDPIQIRSLDDRADIWGTRLVATNVPPGDFGTIAPGAENAVLQTNVYIASDRIYAEASILLQGKAGDAGVQERGAGIVKVGGGTLLEARFDVEDRPYKAGQLVRVFGSLKNVSRIRSAQGQIVDEGKTVGVVIYPTTLGNGVGGFVVRKGSGEQTPKGPTPFVLAPGETIDITAIAPTLEVPTNTWLTLNYEVRGFVFGETPKPRPATPFEVEVVEEPSEGWSGRHQVPLAEVPPVFDPCPECQTDLSHNISLSCCLSQGLYNFGGFAIDTAALAAGAAWEYILLSQRVRAWKQWVFWQTIYALAGDEAAKQRLANEIENDVSALKAAGVQSLQDIDHIGSLILPAMERAFNDTKTVLEKGDLNLVAAYVVKAAGENADMALEAIVAARATYRVLAAVREASQDVATIALRESLQKKKDELPRLVEEFAAKHDGDLSRLPESDVLPVGIDAYDMPRIYRDGHGVSGEVVDAVMGVSKKRGVVLPFRSRSPLSQAKLDAGTHLPKPGGVPAKNISDLDRKYLGVPEHLEGEVVLAEPPIRTYPGEPGYQEKIDEYLRKLPELQFDKGDNVDDFVKNERALAEERLKFQLEEWPKQLENFQRYEREGIDVDFHAEKQGIGMGKFDLGKYLLPNSGAKRAARVERIPFTDPFGQKRVAYRLLMEDAVGSRNFLPITGDIDFLGMFLPDGSMPSLLTRILVYRDLRALGLLEHGESFTFYLEKLRASFLSCCTPKEMGGKGTKMLATTPSGKLLVTQFVDNLSVVEGGLNNAIKVGDDQFAFLAGTMTENFSKERVIFDVTQSVKRDVASLVQASVIARLVSELDALIDRRNGAPVRVGPDGGPQVYTPPADGTQTQKLESPASVNLQHGRAGLSSTPPRPAAALAVPTSGVAAEMAATLAQLIADGYQPEPTPTGAQGGQWRSVGADQIRTGPPGSGLRIAPYTYITEDVPRGSTVIPVLGLRDLGITNASPFFAVGDWVVIDPGGSREEFATLLSVSPFTLSHPLQHLHEMGTTLLFLSGISDAAGLPNALPGADNLLVWLRADAGLSLTNGTNVISWTDQSRNGFVFASRTEAARPTRIANAGNGLAALHFDPAKRNQLQGDLGVTLSNATVFTLMRLNPQTSTRYIYAFGTRNTSGYMMTLARRGGDDAYHYDGAAEWATASSWGDTNLVVLSQVYGGGGPDHHRLVLNGKTVIDSRTTTGRPYSAVATNVVIGNYLSATYHFSGDLVEWIVYNRTLTEAEQSQVEEYLRQRAGLAAFPAQTNGPMSSVNFSVGAGERDTPVWTYNSSNGVTRAEGGVSPSIAVLDQALTREEVHTRISGTGTNGAIGVLFGYEDRGSFSLLDWRALAKTNKSGAVAPAGLRLIQIHMPPGVEAPLFNDFYASTNTANTTVHMTDPVTWIPDRVYDVFLRPASTGLSIQIQDGATELVSWELEGWTGPVGWFGHYSHGVDVAEFGPVTVSQLAVEEPILISISKGTGRGEWVLQWQGEPGSFIVEKTSDLGSNVWQAVGPADSLSRIIFAEGQAAFFRLRRATPP